MHVPAIDLPRTPPTVGESVTRELRRQPLVLPIIGLCLGIGLDAWWHVPTTLAVVVFTVCGIGLWRIRQREHALFALLSVAACCVGTVLHDTALRRVAEDHIVHYTSDKAIAVQLAGDVITTPQIREKSCGLITWNDDSPHTRFVIEARTLRAATGPIDVSGLVAVNVQKPAPEIDIGQRIALTGWLFRPQPPMNPAERDSALTQRRRGIFVGLTCRKDSRYVIEESQDTVGGWLARQRRRVRTAMLEDAYPEDMPGAGLLSAMVLGQRSAVDSDLNDAFVRTGVVHYLSVSGAHVGMIVSAVWLFSKLLGSSRRSFALIAALAATAYALLAEPRPAIVRAAVMTDLLCLGLWWRRPPRPLNWVAMAAMILVLDPLQMFQPGFQLSFVTVAMLILLTRKVREVGRQGLFRLLRWDDPLLQPEMQIRLLPPDSKWHRIYSISGSIGWMLATSVTAWLASLPLTIYHFQQVSLWGWLNTLLVMPLIWVILLIGLVKAIVSMVAPQIGALFGPVLSGLTDFLIWSVNHLSNLPGSGLSTPGIGTWVVLGTLLLMVLWALREMLRIRRRVLTAAALCLGLAVIGHVWPIRSRDTLTLHVLSVGNGSACVVQLPGAGTLVCDLGTTPPYDLYNWTMRPFLARERIYGVDTLVVSHANLDHYSGVPDLVADKGIGRIITPPHFDLSSSARRFIEWMRDHGIERQYAVRGDRLVDTGDVAVEVLWPPPVDQWPMKEANETSLVLRIRYRNKSILLCGDIEAKAQRALLDGHADGRLRSDVLLLPHHGSVTSTTAEFLEAVQPTICIRSSRQPNAETTNGLVDLVDPDRLLNTADCGAITVEVSDTGADARSFMSCQNISAD